MSDKMGRIVKKIINIILNILITIFFIVLIISIYINVQVTVLKNSYANFFGFSIFEVETGSMEPTIKKGDCVIVQMANEFNTNDIVTFLSGEDFITHRVIEAYKGTYVTQGDANNAKDEPISREQIVGKVVKILPSVGIIRNTLMNPGVLIALIITLYLVSLVFKDRKKAMRVKEEVDDKMSIIDKIKTLIDRRKSSKIVESSSQSRMIIEEKIEDFETKIDNVYNEEFQGPKNETQVEPIIEEPVIVEAIEEDNTPIDYSNKKEEKSNSKEEELDKTMYFRMIEVDDELTSIIEDVSKKVVEKEEKLKKTEVKKKETSKEKKKNKKEEPKGEITEELDTIGKKKKKFKNIIEKVMYIKEDELNLIVNTLLKDDMNKPNMKTIKDIFIKSYIDAKYYNYCGNINTEYNKKNMTTKINAALQEKSSLVVKAYKGSDKRYEEKVEKMTRVFNLIIYLEPLFLVDEGIRAKRESYKSKILKFMGDEIFEGPILNTMVNDIILIQKNHEFMVKDALDKLKTNVFKLNTSRISKGITGVYLEHNINFSKVYSDYIVDKTYKEGVVAEDKIAVLITLLSELILNDMLSCEFNQRYLLYIPESLYKKNNKLSNIFDKFADEYAKTCTIILVQYDELSRNSKVIRGLIKEGYKFAVDLSKTDKIKSKDISIMELMSNIFIDKRTASKKAMLSTLSGDAQKRVIIDAVETKVGSFWGVE